MLNNCPAFISKLDIESGQEMKNKYLCNSLLNEWNYD